jgi:hypothetical protein
MPCVLKRGVFGFGSFAGFKWGFPSCLRGPLGLSSTDTTSQEVSSLSRVVEYLFLDVVYADDEILLLAGDSAFRPHGARGRRRLGDCGGAG